MTLNEYQQQAMTTCLPEAQQNLDKLADRKSRQVIDGSGDNR